MKRFFHILLAIALFSQATIVLAQESDEPSEQSVLDVAREKYQQDQDSVAESQDSEAPAADDATGASQEASYTPILISLVPGLSFPFGYHDASLAVGAIGNIARDIAGFEVAGVFNITRDLRGFQEAGVFNTARNVQGFQAAGVFNIVDGDLAGFQAAGVFNIAGKVQAPLQAAGVFNIADEMYGFQAAGVFNISGRVAGGQIAGVFNKADRITGLQIGLVNIARHIDGVQLGLVNIAGNGVDSGSAFYEPQSGFAYAHWQAGTPAFYTAAGIGAPAGDWLRDYTGFVASVGVGSRTRLFGLNLDLDISAEQAIGSLPFQTFSWSRDWRAWEGWAMIKAYPSVMLTLGLPLARHFQIIGGLKADIDVDSLGDRVPAALKVGDSWRGNIFNEGFSVWPKWFFGLKI